MAKLNRFLEETLPSVKKEYKPLTSELNFQPLPESFKMEKKPSNQKTISMSKFGSNIRSGINSLQILSRKNTSSLVNQILSKNHKAPKKLVQHDVFKKSGKKWYQFVLVYLFELVYVKFVIIYDQNHCNW